MRIRGTEYSPKTAQTIYLCRCRSHRRITSTLLRSGPQMNGHVQQGTMLDRAITQTHVSTCLGDADQRESGQTADVFACQNQIIEWVHFQKVHNSEAPNAAGGSFRCIGDPNGVSKNVKKLTVGLCNSLDFVLLLDRKRVGASFGGVDQLIRKTFGDGFHVPKR
jgi:hypothetical protein